MRVVFLFVLMFLPVAALAQNVALVIGNAQYNAVAPLDNPTNDSSAVARMLSEQGFDVVRADNLDRARMRETLRAFRSKADRAEIALVYYAGHGIEIDGVNYLMPVDARLEDVRDAGLEMVEMDLILRQISGASRMKMVVLDACRNNPFLSRVKQRGGARSVRQGLADVRTDEADTLIAYAAAAGAITPDGYTGGNSPFTEAFLTSMQGPPADVRQLLGRVRDRMRQSVPGAAPFVYSSLGGDDYVINPNSERARPAPAAPAKAGARAISQAFIETDRANSFEGWDAFLIRFEDQSSHPLYAFALEKREQLRPQAPAPQAAPAVPARAEPQVEPPLEPEVTLEQITREAQAGLKARGCYLGQIDGDFGRRSRAARDAFRKQAGLSPAEAYPVGIDDYRAVLRTLADHPDVKCPRVARTTTPKKTVTRKTATPQATTPTQPAAEPQSSSTATTRKTSNTDSRFKAIHESGDGYGRRDPTKQVPRSNADCIGSRAKFYDCD